jgi:hypothetical protein
MGKIDYQFIAPTDSVKDKERVRWIPGWLWGLLLLWSSSICIQAYSLWTSSTQWNLWRCWVWLLCGVSDVWHKQKLVLQAVWLRPQPLLVVAPTCFSMITLC